MEGRKKVKMSLDRGWDNPKEARNPNSHGFKRRDAKTPRRKAKSEARRLNSLLEAAEATEMAPKERMDGIAGKQESRKEHQK
jgi:hypothetical protein